MDDRDEPYSLIPKSVKFQIKAASKRKKINSKYNKLYTSFQLKLNATRIDHYFLSAKKFRTTVIALLLFLVIVYVSVIVSNIYSINLYEDKIKYETQKIAQSVAIHNKLSVDKILDESNYFSRFLANFLNDDKVIPLNVSGAQEQARLLVKTAKSGNGNVQWWDIGLATAEVVSIQSTPGQSFVLYYSPPSNGDEAPPMYEWQTDEDGVNISFPYRGNYVTDYDTRKRDWFGRARDENTTVFSEPYITDSKFNRSLVVSTTSPILNEGKFRGVVNVATILNKIQSIIDEASISANSRLAVYTEDYMMALTGEDPIEIFNETIISKDVFSSQDEVMRCIRRHTNDYMNIPTEMDCNVGGSSKTYTTTLISITTGNHERWKLLCMFCVDDLGVLISGGASLVLGLSACVLAISVILLALIDFFGRRFITAQQQQMMHSLKGDKPDPLGRTRSILNSLKAIYGWNEEVADAVDDICSMLDSDDLFYSNASASAGIRDKEVRELFECNFRPKPSKPQNCQIGNQQFTERRPSVVTFNIPEDDAKNEE